MSEYQFYWEPVKEGARLLRVFGTERSVRLPQRLAGVLLTEIGDYCFSGARHLPAEYEKTAPLLLGGEPVPVTELAGSFPVEVILPDTVRKIGSFAFYNCTALEKLELGRQMDTVGSDAFMNCRSLCGITVRCGVSEKSGMRKILSQISSDIEVTFEKEKQVDAIVFYPEYYESLDEITPAHIFSRSIEGEGFRARQCFRDDVADLTMYDAIFPKACAGESKKTLHKIVCTRLCYPVGMTENSRLLYEAYVRSHDLEMAEWMVREKMLWVFRYFCEQMLFSEDAIEKGIRTAAETEWAEGVTSMLHIRRELHVKHQQFESQKIKRYSFDED